MAQEITINASLSCTNGNYSDSQTVNNLRVDQSAQGAIAGTVATSTSEADLTTTGVSTNGWMYLRNLSTTTGENILYGPKSSGVMVAFGTVKPNEAQWFRLGSGVTFRYKSATGTPKLQYWLLND